MLQEIKEFLKGQFTKSLTVEKYHDDETRLDITYTLSNGALNMRIMYNKIYENDDTYIAIYTQNTEETLAIREDGIKSWTFYTKITHLKDIKEFINIIKTKFFPNI